jgi:hypothetical protein
LSLNTSRVGIIGALVKSGCNCLIGVGKFCEHQSSSGKRIEAADWVSLC